MSKKNDINRLLEYRSEVDFSVQHNISTRWNMPDYHFHDLFEIYCTLTDGVRYFVKDKAFILKKGDLMVFNNLDLHKSLVSEDTVYERYIVLFKPEYIQDMSTSQTDLLECFLNRGEDFAYVIHLDEEQLKILLQLFEKARNYCSSKQYGSDIYKKIALCEILLFVNELYRNREVPVNSALDSEYKRIRPVIQYIHGNIGKNLSLANLAERFYISKRHLGYLFKMATGFTINEYVINLRIIKARELLKSNVSVSQAAEMAGFHNLSHFIRTFKKFTGISPKQYSLKRNDK